jgi:hypothetical protein
MSFRKSFLTALARSIRAAFCNAWTGSARASRSDVVT